MSEDENRKVKRRATTTSLNVGPPLDEEITTHSRTPASVSNQRNSSSVFYSALDSARTKQVRRGFRAHYPPQVCGVSFESTPLWLWTLRPSDWETIVISACNEAQLREVESSTWTLFERKFLVVKDGSPSSWARELELANAVVWWGSGASSFCGRALECDVSCPRVFCQVPSPRRTPKATESVEWYSLLHRNAGGTTNARGVFVLADLKKLNIPADLPRTLAHVIKHSIRGKSCSVLLAEPHYTVGDRLTLSRLNQTVLFQSSFSHTGWAHRPLEPDELAVAFKLPDFVKWSEGMSVEGLPLQLLRSVMEAALPQIRELAGVEPPHLRKKKGVIAIFTRIF